MRLEIGRFSRRTLAACCATLLAAVGAQAASAAQRPADPPPVSSPWSAQADGFASVDAMGQNGTTGGQGGEVVTVTNQADLARYAAAEQPYVIQVKGAIDMEPKGEEIEVTSDKTIIGVGTTGEILEGGFFLGTGTHNVIIRNLTIRDTFVEGDWDGQTQDFDGIQMDGAHHVWIDHNHFSRIGDGMIDSREDTSFVTVSWNVFSDHNKTFGIGWTDNVTANMTLHHNWFRDTYQRGPSADNLAHAHLYNNYLLRVGQPRAQQHTPDDVLNGNWARGNTSMVIENSFYDTVDDPFAADQGAELVQRGSILNNVTGRQDTRGEAFDPRSFYEYELTPAAEVPRLVSQNAGPQDQGGSRMLVSQAAGQAAYASVQAAIDAVPENNTEPVTITVEPGTYREVITVPENKPFITLRSASGDPADVVLTYDNSAGTLDPDGNPLGTFGSASVTIEAPDFTAEGITFENSFVEQEGGEDQQAVAVRTVGDRAVFRNSRFIGNQDTLLLDTPDTDVVSRTYLSDCYVEGDVDFIFGQGTAVFDRCEIRGLDRGDDSNNGYVTAASTNVNNPYGFLFNESEFTSDAAAKSYHLGRPWHPSDDPDAIAQVLIRNSTLGAHIKDSPWTEMSGWPWEDARFSEYQNTGPGATVTQDRPQMSEEQAPEYTVAKYLAGSDNWAPYE